MSSSDVNLEAIFAVVLAEAKHNKAFAARLQRAAKGLVQEAGGEPPKPTRRRNRRNPPPFDPFEVFQKDEVTLRTELSKLSLEQLRDIIADCGMDNSRLAAKWKDPDRLRNLIVDTVKSRARKGSVFLTEDYVAEHIEKRGSTNQTELRILAEWKELEDLINALVLHGDLYSLPPRPALDLKLETLRKIPGVHPETVDELGLLARIRNSVAHGSQLLDVTVSEFFATADRTKKQLSTLVQSR